MPEIIKGYDVPNILTFVVPVPHQDAVKDWATAKRIFSETVRSIAAQDHAGWKVVIVANHGADLPTLPECFEVKWVDFPPTFLPDIVDHDRFWDALRLDKGRRVLAGMLHAGNMGHAMVVDYDDLVSKRLTSFVAENQTANGWYIANLFG